MGGRLKSQHFRSIASRFIQNSIIQNSTLKTYIILI